MVRQYLMTSGSTILTLTCGTRLKFQNAVYKIESSTRKIAPNASLVLCATGYELKGKNVLSAVTAGLLLRLLREQKCHNQYPVTIAIIAKVVGQIAASVLSA